MRSSRSSPSAPAGGASPAGQSGNFPDRIDLPDGSFPEGVESGRGTSFFVGSLLDGAIWRGDLRTGSGAVLATGAPGLASAGIAYEARRDRIWVAGGGPQLVGRGDVRVYDASTGALLATYRPPGVGLLNDVAVTRDAVYVTDSGFPQLVVIPLAGDGSLPPPSAARFLPIGGDMLQAPGINLNGIVAESGVLLVANSTTGKLFRVDPATGVADKLDLGGADLSYPDGLELLGHRLYVVRPFDNRVTVIALRARLNRGVVLGDLTDPSLDIPSTATVAAGRLWAVNLRFTTPVEPTTPYWITQLPLRPEAERTCKSRERPTQRTIPMRSILRRLSRSHGTAVAYLALFAALGGKRLRGHHGNRHGHQGRDDHRQGRQEPLARRQQAEREGGQLADGPARPGWPAGREGRTGLRRPHGRDRPSGTSWPTRSHRCDRAEGRDRPSGPSGAGTVLRAQVGSAAGSSSRQRGTSPQRVRLVTSQLP